MEEKITQYDVDKQLMQYERILSISELHSKIKAMLNYLSSLSQHPRYMMLLCHERRDYTVFRFSKIVPQIEQDLVECLSNRGHILRIEHLEDGNWEIWIRDKDTKENVAYYFFDYSTGVLEY